MQRSRAVLRCWRLLTADRCERAWPCVALRGPAVALWQLFKTRCGTGRALSEEQAVRRVLLQRHYSGQLLVRRPARQPHRALRPPPHRGVLLDGALRRRQAQRCERRLVAAFHRRRRGADHRAGQRAPSAGFGSRCRHPAEAGTALVCHPKRKERFRERLDLPASLIRTEFSSGRAQAVTVGAHALGTWGAPFRPRSFDDFRGAAQARGEARGE